MLALLTNDDGIHSPFLLAVHAALRAAGHEVAVAAPAREQSWIGRAVSRYRALAVHPAPELGPLCWAIDGTPTDCVNLALGNLLPRRPDVVVSGINIGFNTTLPMILCSGTVGGATEGAAWGLPALAVSLHVSDHTYEAVREPAAELPADARADLAESARRTAILAAERAAAGPEPGLAVLNVNFPRGVTPATPTVETRPEGLRGFSLFARDEDGLFRFRYRPGESFPAPDGARGDREVIAAGHVSATWIRWDRA